MTFSEINEDPSNRNIQRLINQNKKLREQVFVFQQQMNIVLLGTSSKTDIDSLHQKVKNSTELQKKQFQSQNDSLKSIPNPFFNIDKVSPQQMDKLLSQNSPLIETKIIPSLKKKVESLKAQKIKENIQYILCQEDELKILKKELHSLKKEKELITQFVKDKCEKLQRSNKQIINHKSNLQEQLKTIVDFNRQSSSQITELEREVRKYHFVLQFKSWQKDFKAGISDKNLAEMQKQLSDQIAKIKSQIDGIQSIWKPKIQILDLQYYPLKQCLVQNLAKQEEIKKQFFFQKTRVQAIKDQSTILAQKQRKKLLKINPRLQKQLSDLVKEEQQKLRKKQQYLKSHRPRDTDADINNQSISTKVKGSSKPQNSQVKIQKDDKKIIKITNNRKKKIIQNKQIETNPPKSFFFTEQIRMRRSWSNINQFQEQSEFVLTNKVKDQSNKQKITSLLIQKSIRL